MRVCFHELEVVVDYQVVVFDSLDVLHEEDWLTLWLAFFQQNSEKWVALLTGLLKLKLSQVGIWLVGGKHFSREKNPGCTWLVHNRHTIVIMNHRHILDSHQHWKQHQVFFLSSLEKQSIDEAEIRRHNQSFSGSRNGIGREYGLMRSSGFGCCFELLFIRLSVILNSVHFLISIMVIISPNVFRFQTADIESQIGNKISLINHHQATLAVDVDWRESSP